MSGQADRLSARFLGLLDALERDLGRPCVLNALRQINTRQMLFLPFPEPWGGVPIIRVLEIAIREMEALLFAPEGGVGSADALRRVMETALGWAQKPAAGRAGPVDTG